jgi:protein-S-isoprenylcysteine O-methyltransferase Ste14
MKRPVLELLVVQILAGVVLVASFTGFVLGRVGRRPSGETVHVVAKREPARWTVAVWIVGTFVILLWPVGVLVAPAYAVAWPAVPDFPYSGAVQILGFLLSATGGTLFFSASRALGRHMTPAIQARQDHQLVEEGPYRYIRHPVYTANIVVASGLSLLFLSPPLALLTPLLAGVATYRAHLEEELLGSPEVFGTAYTTYMARTGRFLPRLRTKR